MLDGGAYASSSTAVAANAATLGIGPYEVPNVQSTACGVHEQPAVRGNARIRRGAGVLRLRVADGQAGRRLGLDPVELRIRNAMHEGSVMPNGQVVDSAAPVAELLAWSGPRPLPPAAGRLGGDLRALPGGVSNTTHGEGVVRGVGYGIGIKNVGFSEGFDDYSTARVRLRLRRRARSPTCTPRRPRWARAWSRCRRRSPAPSSASSR